MRQGGVGHPEVMWALRQPDESPLVAPDPTEDLDLAASDDALGNDAAERFLAGQARLWPTGEHPQVVSHASRLKREMVGRLRSGLARSGRYLDMIEREFQRQGVPVELAYLPIIESNFSHDAVGGGTVGLWQFTAGTAKRYGLIVTRDIDERRDPEKASRAAARLLRDLYERFESWDLAIAAYNAGPMPIERALARIPGADFWKLADRGLLPGTTRAYVPKVLATALIASRPENYGLTDIDRSEPLRYDTVVVRKRLDVATIATLCGSSRAVVADLNPSLRTGVVPSMPQGYPIRLPQGTSERFRVQYAAWQRDDGVAARSAI
ncbi:MAG TPA: lytic transglycosylase domain-containing protein [Candidatus Binatia bacterium]|nr:lytic transglycosylase domain-containing protein [Candidatus Binatia bacterium]